MRDKQENAFVFCFQVIETHWFVSNRIGYRFRVLRASWFASIFYSLQWKSFWKTITNSISSHICCIFVALGKIAAKITLEFTSMNPSPLKYHWSDHFLTISWKKQTHTDSTKINDRCPRQALEDPSGVTAGGVCSTLCFKKISFCRTNIKVSILGLYAWYGEKYFNFESRFFISVKS